jgi:hypothetical protein
LIITHKKVLARISRTLSSPTKKTIWMDASGKNQPPIEGVGKECPFSFVTPCEPFKYSMMLVTTEAIFWVPKGKTVPKQLSVSSGNRDFLFLEQYKTKGIKACGGSLVGILLSPTWNELQSLGMSDYLTCSSLKMSIWTMELGKNSWVPNYFEILGGNNAK